MFIKNFTMYFYSVLNLLSWPLFILVSYYIVIFVLKYFEKKEFNNNSNKKNER